MITIKKTMNIFLKLYIFTWFSFSLISGEYQILDLKKSSQNIGGSMGIPMAYDRHEEFKLEIKLNPYYGYFIKDNIELRGGFNFDIKTVFTNQEKKVPAPVRWGIYSDLIFYFPYTQTLIPYVGFGIGWRMRDFSLFSSKLILDFPLGLLIALNSNMAIDIGLPIKWYISYRSILEKIEFPITFLGFRYVF